MVNEAIEKLGEKIGLVEEVETDEEGECIGPFARVRISMVITKPLKRILTLKLEGEEDILLLAKYEKLLDCCFCNGLIGHEFRECIKYKQQKEKLIYRGWMKLPTPSELAKLHRDKNRRNKRNDQLNVAHVNPGAQIQPQPRQKVQQSNADPNKHFGLGLTRMHNSNEIEPMKVNHVAKV